jgi:hypothetical protein
MCIRKVVISLNASAVSRFSNDRTDFFLIFFNFREITRDILTSLSLTNVMFIQNLTLYVPCIILKYVYKPTQCTVFMVLLFIFYNTATYSKYINGSFNFN